MGSLLVAVLTAALVAGIAGERERRFNLSSALIAGALALGGCLLAAQLATP